MRQKNISLDEKWFKITYKRRSYTAETFYANTKNTFAKTTFFYTHILF